jgi:predicted nucleic acid-binding protein
MTNGRRICCIDANILLDFIAGDIFSALFLLPFDFHTSDIVAHEISGSYSHKQLNHLGLTILDLDDAEILEIYSLKQEHIGLSVEDVSVYLLSRKHKTMILSNDGPLRDLADAGRIEYHGTLWLLGQLVNNNLLSPQDALRALRLMISNKRWLPIAECEKMIKRWELEE